MEHFNKANLKASDLMPSRKDGNQNDKSITYKPARSNIANDLSNDVRKSAKAPIHLNNNNNNNISTSNFKQQNSAPLDPKNFRGNIAKDREANNSFYESKHSNKITKEESGTIMEKRDMNKGGVVKIEKKKIDNIAARNRRLRSVENNFDQKNDKNNDQKLNTHKSYLDMNSRPLEKNKELRRKKNNSVNTLPFVKLSQSTMLPQATPMTNRNEKPEPKKDSNPPKPEEKKPTQKKEGKKIPNFRKFERRVSDKNLEYKGKLEMPDNNDDEDNNNLKKNRSRVVKFDKVDEENNEKLPRKKSIGTLRNRKSEKNLIRDISTMTFIQYSEALSTAGRDDDGKKKTNQDSYVLERNINGVLNFNIFGVLDGHGVNGHFASQYVTRYIINRIKNHSLLKNLDNPKDIYNKLKSNKFQIITNIFLDADIQIRKQKFNVEMSGTTAVLVIELDEHIICANTGDSRAILVYDDSKDKSLSNTKIFNLSIDAKPDLPNEKKRIYECGGVVEQVIDETDETVGPYRIWKKGATYPGLAISRTIGDSDAKKIGVIANPDFIEYTITPQTKYIIACSDGIWEFLKNEEVMKIANQFYLKSDPAGLCHELTNKSTANWLKEDVVVDDITVVAAFF